MTKRINKILWNGTEVPQAATRADGLDGLNLGELFIKNDPQEPGAYTRTTDGKVVLLGGGIDKYLHRLFVAIDANGNEIAPNDTTTPIASVRVNYGLWTEQFLSAKGMNSGGGSSEGGATTLGGLRNVAADADNTFNAAKMLVLEADSNLWTLKNLSELVGLDEDALAEYLTNNNYAKKGDIPSLDGYATEQWVLGKGYATTSDLDSRIDALVNGAPAAYDTLKEIADVLANNINSIDDILTALGTKVSKDDFNTAIANVNNSISALNTELSGKIDLKLDAVTFNELFEKVQLEDGTWAIKAKLGLFSDGFISAKGSNVGGTSSEGGAVALYQLNDVLADGTGVSGATDGAVFVYDGKLGKWKGIAQSEIVPNLTGYATESWVLQQGFLTQHQDLSDYAKLSDIPVIPTTDINKGVTAYGWGDHSKVGYLTGITSALVTGALGYTPYNAANFTKANIKSTLGISDWALASSKPSYTTKEVAEDTNLYFTNARAVAALKSITDGLSSSITSNTTKITNLTTKVDDHIAVFNSMFKLVELSDGTMSIQALHGLWSDGFISAKGANTNGGSSSGGGLITSLYRYADLGKTFSDTNNDTFNAYTINKINSDLGSRISVLEGKATNVSFTQSLTSGTQIGSISIDGVTKNIYAPTIPTDDINKGVTAYGWGNHASVGYLTSASNLAWSKITGKPTTIGGYGITDAITTANIGSQSVASAAKLTTARSIWGQSFDGTGNVSGDLHLYTSKIYWWGDATNYCISSVARENSSPYLNIAHYGGISFNTSGYERMYIAGSGNVGIGTTSPAQKLDVNGEILIPNFHALMSRKTDGTQINLIYCGNDDVIKIGGALPIKLQGNTTITGTLNMNAAAMGLGGAIDFQFSDEINRYGGNLYIQHRGDGSQTGTVSGATGNVVMCYNGGNVGIGNSNPQYKLDVVGNVRFSSPTGQNSYIYLNRNGGDGGLVFQDKAVNKWQIVNTNYGLYFYDYTRGVYALTIGIDGVLNYVGTIHSTTGIYSDGYVSAKGQNTSSDMRLKNVLNDVVLNVNDIANAPSVRFAWKNGGGVDVGSSAQYWQGLLPDAVKERDGMLEMQYANIALLSAIAIAKRSENHEERIKRLEKENMELKQRIVILEGGSYA